MRQVRQYTALGMPWHGLATNGTLTTPVGNKTVTDVSGQSIPTGQCLPVKHASPPGITRNAAQQAIDTANGYDWRDYALLCGPERAFNGPSNAELGADRYLYCDPAGSTWNIRIAFVDAGATGTWQVWLDGVFGRFTERDVAFAPRLLTSLSWAPDLAHYGGSWTASQVVDAVQWPRTESIAQSLDGSDCYVNVLASQAATDEVYPGWTQPIRYSNQGASRNVIQFAGLALIAAIRVELSGTGDLDDEGQGIVATCTLSANYAGLVNITQSSNFGAEIGNAPELLFPTCASTGHECNADNPTNPPFDGTFDGETLDWVITVTAAVASGYTSSGRQAGGQIRDGSGVLYRAPWGDVVLDIDYENSLSGTGGATYTVLHSGSQVTTRFLEWNAGGQLWIERAPTTVSGQNTVEVTTVGVTRLGVVVTAFGVEIVNELYERELDTYRMTDVQTAQLINEVITDTKELNGATVANFSPVNVDVRRLAPNLIYAAVSTRKLTGTDHTMQETVLAKPAEAAAASIFNQSTDFTDAVEIATALPTARELVWSYQPFTGDSSHATFTLFQAYSGDVFQYV